jgi:4-nitrophenyl phosphatase
LDNKPQPILALIVDMDGVLWRGEQPIGDLPGIFASIADKGLQITLATNNATRSTMQYLQKLISFGVQLRADQIVNSSQAVAHYLHRDHPQGGKVYIVGENGLAETLREEGFTVVDASPEDLQSVPSTDFIAVVAAMDRQVTYAKLTAATLLIRSGVPFIGTNPDLTFPTPQGLVPGAGAILAAIEAATGVKPDIIGNPSPEMYRVALERMAVAPEQTLVVGDRLETDIAGGQKIGCRTALVLSGVSTLQQAKSWRPELDWIVTDFSSLLEGFDRLIPKR